MIHFLVSTDTYDADFPPLPATSTKKQASGGGAPVCPTEEAPKIPTFKAPVIPTLFCPDSYISDSWFSLAF